MSTASLYLLLFLVAELSVAEGILNNICRSGISKRPVSCDNIYIWQGDSQDFESPMNVTFKRLARNDSKSLQGSVVRVIAYDMMPYITTKNGSDELGGFLGNIWTIIAKALQFRSEIISVCYDDGLEIITSGKADVFLAAAVVKKGLKHIKYSQPYFYNWYHLYMKAPEARASSSSYLKTLDAQLWLASITTFCVLTFLLWFALRLLNKESNNVSLFSCLLAVCAGFLNQGFNLPLNSLSCRLIITYALLFGFLLYSAMNAVLVAKLATYEIKLPFESLDDLAANRMFSVCVRTNSFVYNNFTDANRTILPKWKGIINGPGCLDINNQSNLAEILCENNLVFLENKVVMGSVVRSSEKITCQIINLKEKYFKTSNSFLLWDGFTQGRLIDFYMKKIRNNGVMKRLAALYVKELPVYYNGPKSPEVSMHHVDGIMFMYCAAVLFGLLLLLLELFFKNYFREYNSKFPYVK